MLSNPPVFRALRWLLFTGILAVSFLLLLAFPPERSLFGYVILTAGSILVAFGVQRRVSLSLVRTYRRVIAGVLVLGACVLMGLTAYYFQPHLEALVHYRPTPEPMVFYDSIAAWCLAAGVVLMILALIFARQPIPVPRPIAARRIVRINPWRNLILFGAGVLVMLALAEINGGLLDVKQLEGRSHDLQFIMLIGGIGLVVAGLGGITHWPNLKVARFRRGDPPGRPGRPTGSPLQVHNLLYALPSRPRLTDTRREILLVLLITLLALAVRLYHLGSNVRVLVDEMHFLQGILYFWQQPDVNLLEPMRTNAAFPYIFSYLQDWMVMIFGRNLFGLRAISALMGALTVPALYLLARYMFDRTTAIIAALVLLTFPPHVHYSRLGLNNIADPLFGTLALGFLARGLQKGRRMDYALGGAMLGLTQYFYEGGRLMYPLLVTIWLGSGLLLWRPRPSFRRLIVALVAFVIVAAPIYYTLIGVDFPLIKRAEETTLNDAYWDRDREPDTFHTRLVHFRHSLMMYVNSPENTFVYSYLYYGGKHPLILEYVVPAFLLGSVLVLWRWHTPAILPLIWVLLTSVGNAMLVESAVTARYVVVFPALALLIAVGIRYTIRLLTPEKRWGKRVAGVLMGLVVFVVVVGQGIFYVGPFMRTFQIEVRAGISADAADALFRSVDFPPGTEIHIVGDKMMPEQDAKRLMNFLADNLIVWVQQPSTITEEYMRNLWRGVDHAFFVYDPESLRILGEVYGKREVQFTPYVVPGNKALVLYYIPARFR